MKKQFQDTLVRLTKLLISIGFFLFSQAVNVLRLLLGKKSLATCVALNYHAIAPQHRARFARQMNALMLHAKPIASDQQQPLQPGQHYAVVTFDDGFLSTVENAVPELVQRKIPATFFVVPGLLGKVPQWTEYGRDAIGAEMVASADRLRELPGDLITIGSHTMTHSLMPSFSEAEAKFELSASRTTLQKLFNREIRLFSFPYGAYNKRLVTLCREAGYERVFTTLPGLAFTDPQEFVTGRIGVNPTDWPLEFGLKIRGAYRWLPTAFAWKRMLFGKHLQGRPKVSNVRMGTRSAPNGIY